MYSSTDLPLVEDPRGRGFPVPQPALAERRISNSMLAQAIGYSEQRVSRVLNGYANPSPQFIAGTALALDLPGKILFRDAGHHGT